MNNEIKEILKQCDGVVKREIPLLILAPEYTQLLLDYITNLQEEMEILRSDYIGEKLKNDKAIEYIEKNKKTISKGKAKDTRLQIGTFMWNIDSLLDILRGKDNANRNI